MAGGDGFVFQCHDGRVSFSGDTTPRGALTVSLTKLQSRYTSHKASSAEEFNSASRSVSPGLIAAGIVSAWTWAATLLQSSATA